MNFFFTIRRTLRFPGNSRFRCIRGISCILAESNASPLLRHSPISWPHTSESTPFTSTNSSSVAVGDRVRWRIRNPRDNVTIYADQRRLMYSPGIVTAFRQGPAPSRTHDPLLRKYVPTWLRRVPLNTKRTGQNKPILTHIHTVEYFTPKGRRCPILTKTGRELGVDNSGITDH
jgi:hypothetical protein